MKTDLSDLTTGSLFKKIFVFSVPLIFANLLQILFNMVDSAIGGRFIGAIALGSVGSTGQLIYFFTGFLLGIGGAINVLVAFYIGKKNKKDLDDVVQTAFYFCLVIGILLFIIGYAFAPGILRLLKTKDELLPGAITYFRIYMTCMPFLALYNFGNAVLSAHGKTRLPLYFLALGGIINVILDLVLVIVFKMDVAGLAIATVAAQIISCLLTLISIFATKKEYSYKLKGIKINTRKLLELSKLGIPSGLQNAVFAIANLFVQVGINSFDAKMVAGNAATMNADNLVYNTMFAFYTACATFIGQNYGAGKKDRIKKSYLITLFYSGMIGLVLGILFYAIGPQFLSIFTDDEMVVYYGMKKFKIMTFSFVLSALMDSAIAANRGLGKTFVPSIFVFCGSCFFRVLWIYTVFAHFKTVESLFLLYPASWLLTAVFQIGYFIYVYRKETKDM